MILAGDIGGTKCNLALFKVQGASLQLVHKSRYATREFHNLEAVIDRFFAESADSLGVHPESRIRAAGFGVAGAVVDGRLVANNIPWELTQSAVARKLRLEVEQLTLINDLVATAYGLAHLAPRDFLVLNEGAPQLHGNRALIAAGTGLGEAMMFWVGAEYRASPSEGGSADFAPRNEREIQLVHFLKQQMQRVSCEEVFSGRGFRKLHEFLNPSVLHPTFDGAEAASASEITHNAIEGTCPVCMQVLDWWMDAFGAEAGNLALRVLAYGGVYFAGGIVLKILPKLQSSGFCRSFADKGRLSSVLANIPISIVLNEDAPLIGAAHQSFRTVAAAQPQNDDEFLELHPHREDFVR